MVTELLSYEATLTTSGVDPSLSRGVSSPTFQLRPSTKEDSSHFQHHHLFLLDRLASILRQEISRANLMANPRVFFDITIGGQAAGRIVMEVRIW